MWMFECMYVCCYRGLIFLDSYDSILVDWTQCFINILDFELAVKQKII
jgi:hypothetical protein